MVQFLWHEGREGFFLTDFFLLIMCLKGDPLHHTWIVKSVDAGPANKVGAL